MKLEIVHLGDGNWVVRPYQEKVVLASHPTFEAAERAAQEISGRKDIFPERCKILLRPMETIGKKNAGLVTKELLEADC